MWVWMGKLELTSRKSSRSRSNLSSDGDERRVGKYRDSTTVGIPSPMMQFTIHHHIISALKNLTRNFVAIYMQFIRRLSSAVGINHTKCQMPNAGNVKNPGECVTKWSAAPNFNLIWKQKQNSTHTHTIPISAQFKHSKIRTIHSAFCIQVEGNFTVFKNTNSVSDLLAHAINGCCCCSR